MNDHSYEKYLDIIMEGIYPPRFAFTRALTRCRLRLYLNYVFQDVSFRGKSMLDIGGGSGWLSFFGACMGAQNVICLEPELKGSTKGIIKTFYKLYESLSSSTINFQPVRIQDFDAGNQTFDIILSHASINHLDEEACIKLQYDDEARKRYSFIFQKLSKLAAPGSKLIIVDCSNHNFFAALGRKNPFAPTIEWHKHQPPEFWSNLLLHFGFTNPKIRWIPVSFMLDIGKLLLSNRFASFFFNSAFCLVLEKKLIARTNV